MNGTRAPDPRVDALYDSLLTDLRTMVAPEGSGIDTEALAGWMVRRHWRVRALIHRKMGLPMPYLPSDRAISACIGIQISYLEPAASVPSAMVLGATGYAAWEGQTRPQDAGAFDAEAVHKRFVDLAERVRAVLAPAGRATGKAPAPVAPSAEAGPAPSPEVLGKLGIAPAEVQAAAPSAEAGPAPAPDVLGKLGIAPVAPPAALWFAQAAEEGRELPFLTIEDGIPFVFVARYPYTKAVIPESVYHQATMKQAPIAPLYNPVSAFDAICRLDYQRLAELLWTLQIAGRTWEGAKVAWPLWHALRWKSGFTRRPLSSLGTALWEAADQPELWSLSARWEGSFTEESVKGAVQEALLATPDPTDEEDWSDALYTLATREDDEPLTLSEEGYLQLRHLLDSEWGQTQIRKVASRAFTHYNCLLSEVRAWNAQTAADLPSAKDVLERLGVPPSPEGEPLFAPPAKPEPRTERAELTSFSVQGPPGYFLIRLGQSDFYTSLHPGGELPGAPFGLEPAMMLARERGGSVMVEYLRLEPLEGTTTERVQIVRVIVPSGVIVAQGMGEVDWGRLPPLEGADLQTEAQRRHANERGIRLLADLYETRESLAPRREPTEEEQEALRLYSGWGGVAWDKIALDVRPPDEEAVGLLYQYYTPTIFCRAVWHFLDRFHGGTAFLPTNPRALEPSAGSGRFVEAAPPGIDWTGVELDPIAYQILRALQPNIALSHEAFEEWMVGHPLPKKATSGDFDLVIANPPYAGRGQWLSVDPAGRKWKDAAHYFLDAGARRLRPGGIMVQLVPLGTLVGLGTRKLREALLKRCHLLGAYLPPSTMFPGARLNLALEVWQARGSVLAEVRSDDTEILEGNWLLTDEGKAAIGGEVTTKTRQHRGREGREDEWEVTGDFEPNTLVNMKLRPVPADVLAEMDAARQAPPEPPPCDSCVAKIRARKPKAEAAPGVVVEAGDPVSEAALLGTRLLAQRTLSTTDTPAAERGRPELLADVKAWVERYGSPHKIPDVARSKEREVLALLGAVAPSGALPKDLTDPLVDLDVTTFRGDRSDLVAVVDSLAAREGEAPWSKIHRVYSGQLSAVATTPEVCIVWSEDPTLIPRREYATGDLYAKFDALARVPAGAPAWVKARYDEQRVSLLTAIDPLPMGEIVVELRSGFTPPECLGEFLTAVSPNTPVENPRVEEGVFVSDTIYSAKQASIIAYVNRETKFDTKDERTGKDKAKSRHGAKSTLEEKMEADAALDRAFCSWVRQSEKWAPIIENLYNRAYRGFKARTFSGEPLGCTRLSTAVSLRPHQNAAVRQITGSRGGLCAHDVGVGKTFIGLALVAYWRQLSIARRPLIVVPKQVLSNWLREANLLLPDYQVLTIGMTRNPETGKIREDSKETKRKKWHLYASGHYELAITTFPAFEDVGVTPPNKRRLFDENQWLVREAAMEERDKENRGGKLESMRAELRSIEGIYYKAAEAVKLRAAIAKAEARVEGSGPSARRIQEARQQHEQWIAERQYVVAQREEYVFWEDLGIDLLIVDEAHNYKNLLAPENRYGKKPKYMGGGSGDVKRCWDLWLKTMVLREQHDSCNVVLLTATPLKNSPLEIFTLLTYCRPELFQARGIRNHEEFIDRYIVLGTADLLNTDGKLEELPFVDGFTHLVEMRQIMSLIIDYRTAEDVGLKIPEAVPHFQTIPMQEAAKPYYEALRKRVEAAMHAGRGEPKEGRDHIFSIMRQMHIAALDMRQVDPGDFAEDTGLDLVEAIGEDREPPKFQAMVREITKRPNCAHVVFIDCKDAHEDAIASLVAGGIQRSRIERIFGEVSVENRQKITDRLNGTWEAGELVVAPTLDVVIGNSSTMAEGMNLQKRTCAIHHLELPWEPATLQQRNGRGVRQGNKFALVDLFYYITEKSFDGYRLQLISGKKKWMNDLFRGTSDSMSNPCAEMSFSPTDLAIMFSADPAAERAKMEERLAEKRAERLEKRRKDAAALFVSYVQRTKAARYQTDPVFRASMLARAQDIRDNLRDMPDDVFPHKDLITRAEEVGIYYDHKTGMVYIEGEPVCFKIEGSPVPRLVLNVEPAYSRITMREEGSFVPLTMTFEQAAQYQPAPTCAWSPEADTKMLEATRYFFAKDLKRVVPDLFARYKDKLWELAKKRTDAPESAIPYAEDGKLVARSWWDARDHEADPIWPDAAGWAEFKATPGGESFEDRIKIAQGWFGRFLSQDDAKKQRKGGTEAEGESEAEIPVEK